MKKKRKDDEVTRLEKSNRELKSLNRSLMKRLKKVDKHWKDSEKEAEDEAEEEIQEKFPEYVPPTLPPCPDCGGDTCAVKVAGRSFTKCLQCKWRTKAVKA